MLYWLPLEQIDKRYTVMTRKVIRKELIAKQTKYKLIDGVPLTSTIDKGSFLDCYSTIHFKSTQIAKIAKLFSDGEIKDGDKFFIDDLWLPGVESIRYMAGIGGVKNIKIYGIMHAGSWIPSDDVATKLDKKWTKPFEEALFEMTDMVFVGSHFHKDVIEEYFGKKLNITVTGLLYNSKEVERTVKKENIVVFPHRNHPEKQPEIFSEIKGYFKVKRPDIKFVTTYNQDLNKEEYYNLLAKSKVVFSAALQENFGYSILECCSLNVIPVLPKQVVYPEFYPTEHLYNDVDEAMTLIERYIDRHDKLIETKQRLKEIPRQFDSSFKRMLSVVMDNG